MVTRHLGIAAAMALATMAGLTATPASALSDYLYVWAGDVDKAAGDKDFLATIDIRDGSPTFGQVISTAPVPDVGTMPHHIEPTVSQSDDLFASGFMANKIYRFDMSDPAQPILTTTISAIPGWKMSHSFVRTPENKLIGTMQYKADDPKASGGITVISAGGEVLQTVSAQDPNIDAAPFRSYGVDVAPEVNRIVVTSTPMAMETPSVDAVQIYDMTDISLLKTIELPVPEADPSRKRHAFEIRTLADGKSMMLNTFQCGFYLVDGLETDNPTVEFTYAMSKPNQRACSVPSVVGNYWVMPIQKSNEVVVLDISNPRNPKEVFSLPLNEGFSPHYSAAEPGNNRIALTGFMGGGDLRVLMLRIDEKTGALSIDGNFRDPNSGGVGVDFKRAMWPHGATGPAIPHGIVWSKKK